jgi:hypothetical protein
MYSPVGGMSGIAGLKFTDKTVSISRRIYTARGTVVLVFLAKKFDDF